MSPFKGNRIYLVPVVIYVKGIDVVHVRLIRELMHIHTGLVHVSDWGCTATDRDQDGGWSRSITEERGGTDILLFDCTVVERW